MAEVVRRELQVVALGTALQWEHTALYERRTITARVVDKPFFDPPRKRGDA